MVQQVFIRGTVLFVLNRVTDFLTFKDTFFGKSVSNEMSFPQQCPYGEKGREEERRNKEQTLLCYLRQGVTKGLVGSIFLLKLYVKKYLVAISVLIGCNNNLDHSLTYRPTAVHR